MAVKNFYALNSLTSTWQALQEDGTAPTLATSAMGWTVGKTAATAYSDMAAGTERLASTFGATVLPAAAVPSSGNAFRSQTPLTGTFAAGTWNFAMVVRAVDSGGAQDGNIRYRLYKGTAADGSNATEFGGAVVVGSTVTNLATSADQTSSASTGSLGAISFNNEYLFIKAAWQISGAGSANAADVLMRIGSGTRLLTPDFTPSFTGTATSSAFGQVDSSGAETFSGAATSSAFNQVAASGAETFSGAATSSAFDQVVAAGEQTFSGAATSSAFDQLTAAGAQTFSGAGESSGFTVPELLGEVEGGITGDAVSSAAGTTDAVGEETFAGAASSSAFNQPSGSGEETFSGTVSSSAAGSAALVAEETFGGDASSGAAAGTSGVGEETFSGTATSSAFDIPEGVGEETFTGAAASSAAGTTDASGVTFGGVAESSAAGTTEAEGFLVANIGDAESGGAAGSLAEGVLEFLGIAESTAAGGSGFEEEGELEFAGSAESGAFATSLAFEQPTFFGSADSYAAATLSAVGLMETPMAVNLRLRTWELWDIIKARLNADPEITNILGGPRVYKASDDYNAPEADEDTPWGRVVIVPSDAGWPASWEYGKRVEQLFLIRAEMNDYKRPGYDVARPIDAILDHVFHSLDYFVPLFRADEITPIKYFVTGLPIWCSDWPQPMPMYDEDRGIWWKTSRWALEVAPVVA